MADTDLVRDTNELDPEELRRRLSTVYGPSTIRARAEDLETPLPPGIVTPPPGGGTLPVIGERPSRPTARPGTIEDTENRLQQIQWEKEHPWGTEGSTHPGTLGKVGHIASKIGNIAGDVFLPNVMARIPGTELHRDLEQQTLETRLGQQQREASEEGLRNVQEENLRSEIEARRNPKPKLLAGEENIAVGPDGKRYQRYEMPDQTTQWAEEGTVPAVAQAAPTTTAGTLPSIGAQTTAAPGALPKVTPPLPSGGGLPAGAVVGKPAKPAQGEEKFVTDYLADNKLPDTAENRQKAIDEYKAGGAIGEQRANQYTAQIKAALKGTNIDPGGYAVTKDSKIADAKEALAAAQREASLVRQTRAPDAAQRRKDEHEMGYAVNPANGKLEYMSRAQADDQKSLFEPVKDTKADRQAIRQLNDIQKNISAYTKAINDQKTPIEHGAAMRRIEAGVNPSDVEKMGYVTMGSAMDMMEQGEVGKAWNQLTPTERSIMIGYLRAKGAMIAYNRVVSGSARTNKEALEVEWHNLPSPYVGSTVANDQMRAMQENLDRVEEGFPTNLPGLRTPENVREETEGRGGNAPPAGARVRNYNPATGQLE